MAIIVVACVIAALAYRGTQAETYSPLNHWISELGESSVSSLGGVFNAGLVAGGGLFLLFQVGLVRATTGWLRFPVLVIGIVSGIAGILVGAFPMDHGGTHTLVALTFFLTGWIGPLLVSLRLLDGSKDGLPRWLVVPGVVAAVAFGGFLFLIFLPGGEARLIAPDVRPGFWLPAALEWLSLIAILTWTACTAAVLTRRPAA